MNKRLFLSTLVLVVGAAAGVPSSLRADEPKGDQKQGPNIVADKAPAADSKQGEMSGVEQVALAQLLVKYGRASKEPMALLTAAKVLAGAGMRAMEMTPETKPDEKPAGATGGQTDHARPSDEPTSLVAEARQMGEGNAPLATLADQVAAQLKEKSRGRLPGPFLGRGSVPSYSTQTIVWTFEGDERAEIAISGDGDTDLDLYVYDENGNLITSDTDSSDDCIVRWQPRWTGKYIIRIKNRGSVYNEYRIATN